jgi:hypothetical protein
MDSDEDEVSVASTPVRIRDVEEGLHLLRRTRSLDDCSILESVSDIIVPDQDYSANISPIEPESGRISESPTRNQGKVKPMASMPSMPDDPRCPNDVSPDQEPTPFTWVRGSKASPDVPPEQQKRSPRSHNPKSRSFGTVQDVVAARGFWSRSPIAKGMKDAIFPMKRSSTPTSRPDRANVRRNSGAPATPTRTDSSSRRGSISIPAKASRSDFSARRCSTPTRLETMGRQKATPTMRGEVMPRRSSSPSIASRRSASPNWIPFLSIHSPKSDKNSNDSQGMTRQHSFRRSSPSFGMKQENDLHAGEVYHEFRALRRGKLGLLINTSPQTGPMVEQVKDYSTLFGRIRAGDRIVEVDGIETSNMTIKEVTKRLNGKFGIRATPAEVRIKIARVRERKGTEEDRDSVNSIGSASMDSFSSHQHRRNHSDPEPLLDRLSMNSLSDPHRLSSYSYSNHSKSGEEV